MSIGSSGGAYVFISSVAAQHAYPGIADYCAAKAALTAFSRSLATDLAPMRGRSNTISPAVVNTPLLKKSPFTVEEAASWHKLGRIGEPSEIAAFAEYLASTNGRWITGRDFVIDGGMLL
jgi:NAD(P)-dependent dehydrogenase (short-subunit alcohol dehydrogenase family)